MTCDPPPLRWFSTTRLQSISASVFSSSQTSFVEIKWERRENITAHFACNKGKQCFSTISCCLVCVCNLPNTSPCQFPPEVLPLSEILLHVCWFSSSSRRYNLHKAEIWPVCSLLFPQDLEEPTTPQAFDQVLSNKWINELNPWFHKYSGLGQDSLSEKSS